MIGFGFIGASQMAQNHMLPAIRHHPDCDVVSVYSTSAERGQAYAAANQIAQSTTSLAELLANPGVQAVYISTTNERHHAQALAAARAGKHVWCEKPLAMTVAEAQEMVAVCREQQVVLATNHHLRNASAHRRMRELIAAGAIGEPLAVRVFHATYLRESLQGWRLHKPQAGAGVVLDIAVHGIDTMRYVLQAEPVEVVSLSQHYGMASETIEDGSMAVFRFDNGVLAQLHTAFTVKYSDSGFEVHGTEGSLIGRHSMKHPPGAELILRNADGEQSLELDNEPLHHIGTQRFVGAIQGRGEPAATGEDGLRSLAAALACLKAATSGGKQTITV